MKSMHRTARKLTQDLGNIPYLSTYLSISIPSSLGNHRCYFIIKVYTKKIIIFHTATYIKYTYASFSRTKNKNI